MRRGGDRGTFDGDDAMTAQVLLRRGGTALGSIGAAAILYRLLLRHRILNWGATDAEANARLPGDELLEQADGVATRAITINAPASAVWPWIAQMGPSPRGGAYTYDWIENLLGLDMHSTDRVLPEYQHPASRRHARLRQEPHARRTRRTRARAREAVRRRQLGLELRARRARRKDTADQPQPLPAPLARPRRSG